MWSKTEGEEGFSMNKESIAIPIVDTNKIEKIEKEIKSELEPFLDGIRTGRADVELFKEAYYDFWARYTRAWKLFSFILKDFLDGLSESRKTAQIPRIRGRAY